MLAKVPEEGIRAMERSTLLGRLAETADMAGVVCALADPKLLLDPLALDRVPDRANQNVGIDPILHQVVLSATLDRGGRDLAQSTQRLADGQLDAFFYAGGTPFAALIQLGSTKGFELYRFSKAEQKDINKIIPYYVDSMIPAGTYESIDYDVPTLAVNGQLVTSVEQPDELIYEITKALWNKNTRKLLDKGHSKGKAIRLETALKGVLIPVHPGAAKFYKEAGVMK